ncbi:MAG: succinate--CoA ligase subunit beta [Gammaproteobacteria bacterium TMED159]|nr:MAG: succinate--CoA ligase subunit beta [Gammaproteobacteria bacterium TMED159]
MNLHEYQSKQLLENYGLPTAKSVVAFSLEEVTNLVKDLNGSEFVAKVQVHAGGRGKLGGVKITKDINEIKKFAQDWLGKKFVNHQTGEEGKPVSAIMIAESTDIKNEFYLGAVIDRSSQSLVVMASPEGGMDIEKVAEESPDKIFKINIKNEQKEEFDITPLVNGLGLSSNQTLEFKKIVDGLVNLFFQKDLSLIEINPLVIDQNDSLKCLDAKINIDENALFRQEDLIKLRDYSQENQKEIEAAKWDLNYVALDGNIGCMVNGAGLAMATMDIIKLSGGFPANFLDVGGTVDKERVAEAFKIILSDENVKSVLINIFGGIVRCDVVASGIVSAVSEVGVDIPVIVRLKGNNSEEAKQILAESDLNIISADDLSSAAELAVKNSK